MADNTTSHTQQKQQEVPNPFGWFNTIVSEQLAQIETWNKEIAKLDEVRVEKTTEAIDEFAKLMKASVDYTAKLNNTWRKLTLDAMRKGSWS